MNVEKLFDKIVVYKNTLSFEEKEDIVIYILDITENLPIKKPFSKEQLLNFEDKDLILYLVDVNELFGIKYFYDINKQL